ncbi:MAG: T9SS type A sorting domain-containing protein [Bacteroidota bacterium]
MNEVSSIPAPEQPLAAQFQLFPNPTAQRVTVDFEEQARFERMEILNLQGKVLLAQEVGRVGFEIDVSRLPVGLYLVSMIGERGRATQKLLKQ